MTSTICIYHGNCQDGFTAAWVVHKALGGRAEFHPGIYQDSPPDVTGKDVIIVDFSYKKPILEEMATKANSIIILDHHKTAEEDLKEYKINLCGGAKFVYSDIKGMWEDFEELKKPKIIAEFDMDRSGAMMAWHFFFPEEYPPTLLYFVQDRDLWKFYYPNTKDVSAFLFSQEYDFQTWYKLVQQLNFGECLDKFVEQGAAINRKQIKDVNELVKILQREMIIGGVKVAVANLPYTYTSDAGELMAINHNSGIGVCYWDTSKGRVFSLRSIEGGPDVSAIAKKYGGGGHKHAAGFRVAIGWEGEN
jgi:nanoRNase/pAp phosphatase (c-di-AMP/oligoRNAs hydrolase)